MAAVFKRLLNVLTVLCTLYLVLLLIIGLFGGVNDWEVFVGFNSVILIGGYSIIAAINYIAFGKVALWNRRDG